MDGKKLPVRVWPLGLSLFLIIQVIFLGLHLLKPDPTLPPNPHFAETLGSDPVMWLENWIGPWWEFVTGIQLTLVCLFAFFGVGRLAKFGIATVGIVTMLLSLHVGRRTAAAYREAAFFAERGAYPLHDWWIPGRWTRILLPSERPEYKHVRRIADAPIKPYIPVAKKTASPASSAKPEPAAKLDFGQLHDQIKDCSSVTSVFARQPDLCLALGNGSVLTFGKLAAYMRSGGDKETESVLPSFKLAPSIASTTSAKVPRALQARAQASEKEAPIRTISTKESDWFILRFRSDYIFSSHHDSKVAGYYDPGEFQVGATTPLRDGSLLVSAESPKGFLWLYHPGKSPGFSVPEKLENPFHLPPERLHVDKQGKVHVRGKFPKLNSVEVRHWAVVGSNQELVPQSATGVTAKQRLLNECGNAPVVFTALGDYPDRFRLGLKCSNPSGPRYLSGKIDFSALTGEVIAASWDPEEKIPSASPAQTPLPTPRAKRALPTRKVAISNVCPGCHLELQLCPENKPGQHPGIASLLFSDARGKKTVVFENYPHIEPCHFEESESGHDWPETAELSGVHQASNALVALVRAGGEYLVAVDTKSIPPRVGVDQLSVGEYFEVDATSTEESFVRFDPKTKTIELKRKWRAFEGNEDWVSVPLKHYWKSVQ